MDYTITLDGLHHTLIFITGLITSAVLLIVLVALISAIKDRKKKSVTHTLEAGTNTIIILDGEALDPSLFKFCDIHTNEIETPPVYPIKRIQNETSKNI